MTCKERILSDDYFDIIVDFSLGAVNTRYDLCAVNVENRYNIIYWNRNQLSDPNHYFYDYRSVPKLYGLMQQEFDPTSLLESGIIQVQREPLELTGRGCVIVFIDTGIDYTSALFRNPDGSSRILAIWDQTIQTGTPPEGFFYGSEYRREEINRALASETPYEIVPSVDEIGHGTDLAAVAAGGRGAVGSGAEAESIITGDFLGAAPEADIVVVKLKESKQYLRDFYLVPEGVPAYEETDIMLGVRYGDGFARAFRRPVVFCIGLGTGYGDHAGSSALPEYLNSVAVKRSRAVVVCSGNEGNAAHHYQGSLNNRGTVGDNREAVEIRVGQNAKGFLLELWGSVPDVFAISVRSPGGETIPPIRLGLEEVNTYGFIYERTRISVAGILVEPASGEELVTLRVEAPTPGIWTFYVEAAGEIHNGTFHMWLPITQFLNTEVYFLQPTPYITLTEPAMAANAISVSTYNAVNDSFYIASGRGFSRTGAIKPDFAAPGVNVSVPGGSRTGSSLAAAITAGAVAQFMQWAVVDGNNPVVESLEIRNYFIRGARRSFDMTYPNREWGYGTLNVAGVFDALVGV